MKDYLFFVKWYFKLSTNKLFPRTGSRYLLGQKERLPLVVLGYVLLLINIVVALFHVDQGFWKYLFIGILELSSLLFVCRFSFIYYFFLYSRFVHRVDSVNDRILVDEIVLLEPSEDVRRMISKNYRIIEVRGSIYAVKYYIVEKTKRYKKLSNRDLIILKITPKKILLNKKEVFSHKITDMSALEDCLQEMHK